MLRVFTFSPCLAVCFSSFPDTRTEEDRGFISSRHLKIHVTQKCVITTAGDEVATVTETGA